jgi:glycosyltransferase involved in cell wall biosynthesis
MNIDVSIIIINYKTLNYTISAVDSVIEKTNGINFEIIIVDNNSNDGSIETIENRYNTNGGGGG